MVKQWWALSVVSALSLAGCGGGGSSGGGGGSPFAVANPFALPGATNVTQVQVDDLRVFGDSYSVPGRSGTVGWSEMLENRGVADRAQSYAVDGARADSDHFRSFDDQLDAFNETIGDGDLTVVYLGYNDIVAGDTGDSKVDYQAGINRLRNVGAASADRRLFVTMLHDWGRNPGAADAFTARTDDWNDFIAGVANADQRVVAVDLFTVFERVFTDPAEFGFTNVTSADAANAGINGNALYIDDFHFGDAGLQLVSRVYEHYLTRGWDWANSFDAGAQATQRLEQDLDNGLITRLTEADAAGTNAAGFATVGEGHGRARGVAQPRLGLAAIPLGNASAEAAAMRDPTRASFNASHGGPEAAGGLALDYRLAEARHFGFALARYEDGSATERSGRSATQARRSEAMALYWADRLAGFDSETRLAYLEHRFADRSHDVLLGARGTTEHDGSTWSLEQKIARATDLAAGTVTPWASLAYRAHALESYAAESLYTSDLRFAGDEARDVIGAIGVDLASDAIALPKDRRLWLGARLGYEASLYREDLEARISEAATPNAVQRETLERPSIGRFDLGLDAVLGLSPDLELRAGYALTAAGADEEQRLRIGLDYRF